MEFTTEQLEFISRVLVDQGTQSLHIVDRAGPDVASDALAKLRIHAQRCFELEGKIQNDLQTWCSLTLPRFRDGLLSYSHFVSE